MFSHYSSKLKSTLGFGRNTSPSFQLNNMSNTDATTMTANNFINLEAGGVVMSGTSPPAAMSSIANKPGSKVDVVVTASDEVVGAGAVGNATAIISGRTIGPGTEADHEGVISTQNADSDGHVATQAGPLHSVSNLSFGEIVARPELCQRPPTSSATRLVDGGYHTGTDPEAQIEGTTDGDGSFSSQNPAMLCVSVKKISLCEAGMYLFTFLACFGTLYAAFGRN